MDKHVAHLAALVLAGVVPARRYTEPRLYDCVQGRVVVSHPRGDAALDAVDIRGAVHGGAGLEAHLMAVEIAVGKRVASAHAMVVGRRQDLGGDQTAVLERGTEILELLAAGLGDNVARASAPLLAEAEEDCDPVAAMTLQQVPDSDCVEFRRHGASPCLHVATVA